MRLTKLLKKLFPNFYQRIRGYPLSIPKKGGHFGSYIFNSNIQQKIHLLKANLDNDSINVVDRSLELIWNLPEWEFKHTIRVHDLSKIFDVEDFEKSKEIERHLKNLDYYLPEFAKDLDPSVFYYHHGLKTLPKRVLSTIQNKDFLDLGAYIGDSALVLAEYNPSAIYSFDISSKTLNELRKVLEKNLVATPIYDHCLALGDSQGIVHINDSGTIGQSVHNKGTAKIKQDTVDHFVESNKLDVGLIKSDIEGESYKMVLAAENTIKKQRPILSIAIYHNPYEFFEIKPLLECWVPEYKFSILNLGKVKTSTSPLNDLTLLAYVP